MRSWIIAAVLVAAVGASTSEGAEALHGSPVALSAEQVELLTTGAAGAVAPAGYGDVTGLSVDTGDRLAVLDFYHCIYLASEGYAARMGWVGNIGSCDEGTVAAVFHDDTLRRINYFRAMAGLPGNIAFSAVKNAKCQEAALIMARNGGLSHDPIGEHPTWSCLTADGDEAAGASNLSFSTGPDYDGPAAIDGQMYDAGVYNVPVGHRRWLLYSRAQEMANGGIPGQGSYGSAAAIWVIGNFKAAPSPAPRVAWPPAGYVPYTVVYPRWSFSLPGGNFDSATVTMSRGGNPVTATKIHPTPSSPAAGYGDPTIVWEPQGLPTGAPAADTTYTVTISGVTGVSPSSYTYDVTIIDPDDLGGEVACAGPAAPLATATNVYALTPIAGVESYDLRVRKLAATNWIEGAESSPVPRILDGTSASYALIQSSLVRTGSQAFHMAFPVAEDQAFEIDRDIVPSGSSHLTFAYRRRFSHTSNTLTAGLSTDDGATWTSLWSQSGVCGETCSSTAWDSAWLPVTVSLASYDGVPVRLRFTFARGGINYFGTDVNYGVFIDDATVSNPRELVSETVTSLGSDATSFEFVPDGCFGYIIDLRASIECRTFGYGPTLTVNSAPYVCVDRFATTGANLSIGFYCRGGEMTGYNLLRASDPAGVWSNDPAAVFDAGSMRFTTPATPPAFYRVRGSR